MRGSALALLLLGCAGSLPPGAKPVSPAYMRGAIEAWTVADYPRGSCDGWVDDTYQLVTDADGVAAECRQERAAGCLVLGDVGPLGLGGDYALIVMDREYAGPWLLAHETVHLLAICSGLPAWKIRHDDPRFFHAPGSMQARIAEVLKGTEP